MEVSHAITFKGASLAWAILNGYKKVENRTFRLPKNKWIAIHIGQGVLKHDYRKHVPNMDMPSEKKLICEWNGSIVGFLMIKEHRRVVNCGDDRWATGPVCNIILKTAKITTPIREVKGHLGIWKLEERITTRIKFQSLENIVINDLSMFPTLRPISIHKIQHNIPSDIVVSIVYGDIESDQIFDYLSGLSYEYHKKYRRFNKIVKVPRGQASFILSEGVKYAYKAAGGSPPNVIADCRMKGIIETVNYKLGTNFNTCLMNVYENGEDCIGFHSDDETGWVEGTGFATVAFGTSRDLQVKGPNFRSINIPHSKGCCIHFKYPSNSRFQHAKPKRKRVLSKHISITLREIRVS